MPLRPLFLQGEIKDWPMINMRAKEAERAAQMFQKKKPEVTDNDDMFFDAKEFHTTNKEINQILS